ncbi:MAG: aminotransferase class I/II-fold pyridoxal phosphate-dependent enzyme [Clostridia bacterium]|nr:aminotransferase class I/II-fold pyridoxal phosphate-dependent enzyme [Clostridia bacterium]
MIFQEMNKQQLKDLRDEFSEKYNQLKSRNLSLDMSRGKPSPDQLDLSIDMLGCVNDESGYKAENGFDCRNYGVLDGIPECKKLFANLLEVDEKNIIIGGNSSLTIMFDYITQCMISGAGEKPWGKQNVKFICPVPGYDRHFSICEYFGIEMITVDLLEDGPDMDKVEELIKDPSVKGMFVVPKYSNPCGNTFSDECVMRFSNLKPAAKDFRVIWDNAYCIHDIAEDNDKLMNIFEACKGKESEDFFVEVTSTSKISFPGSGVSAIAASEKNIDMIKKRMAIQTIGNDKLNQLRHVRFFKDVDGLKEHMKLHAEKLKPRFDVILDYFEKELSGKGIAKWSNPKGGYFISLDIMNGCAKKVVSMCSQAGIVLTDAGATYPYGIDKNDSNIRIAPSYPSIEELKDAVEGLCICIKLVCAEKLLEN